MSDSDKTPTYGRCDGCGNPAILSNRLCIACLTMRQAQEKVQSLVAEPPVGKLEIAGAAGPETVEVLRLIGGASLLCRDRGGRRRVVNYANAINPRDFTSCLNHLGASIDQWHWENGDPFQPSSDHDGHDAGAGQGHDEVVLPVSAGDWIGL